MLSAAVALMFTYFSCAMETRSNLHSFVMANYQRSALPQQLRSLCCEQSWRMQQELSPRIQILKVRVLARMVCSEQWGVFVKWCSPFVILVIGNLVNENFLAASGCAGKKQSDAACCFL